jgi:hypothetical protein
LDATDTNTYGPLVIFVHESGALTVRVECVVMNADAYDALYAADGTGHIEADAVQISGDATAANNLELATDGTGYGFTGCTMPTVTTLTGHTVQTGDSYARLGAPVGASVSADIAVVDANVDAVLVDTGTTLDAALAVVDGNVDAILVDTGTTLPATLTTIEGKVDTVDTNVDAILVDTAEIGAAGVGLTAVPWNASWDAEVQSEVQDALEANDLDHFIQVTAGVEEPTDGSYLDQIMHAGVGQTFDATTDSLEALRDRGDAAWITAPNDPTAAEIVNEWETQSQADPTGFHVNVLEVGGTAQTANDNGADINAILVDTNELQTDWVNGGRLDLLIDQIITDIAALNNVSTAEVNAQVLDVLNTDTFAEPGQGAPGATITLAAKIGYLYKFARNKLEQTATTLSIYDDSGATVDQKATVSDDATTYTRGEIGSGP